MAENDVFERSLADAFLRLTDGVPKTVDAVTVAHRVAVEHPRRQPRALRWRVAVPRGAWLLLAAGLLFVLIGGALVAGSQRQRLPAVVPPVEPSAAPALVHEGTPSPAATITDPAGTWDPILATTRAEPAPIAAICPTDADPDTPGPVGQDRPEAGWPGNHAAAFDRRTGRIVYVDTRGETWTFDVCTNTWLRMHPTGQVVGELSGGLVYDVDSDLTVALGFDDVWVYDAHANTWNRRAIRRLSSNTGKVTPFGGTYDPVTGLIITSNAWISETAPRPLEFWAYDVDTDDWTLVGPLSREPSLQDQLDLLGYSGQLDRLVVAGVLSDEVGTILVDPRTGDVTELPIDSPVVDLGWPGAVYGHGADTVYVKPGGGDVCGFDAGASAWTACFDTPLAWQANQSSVAAAMIGDPINQRLVLINRVGGAWWSEATDDVWAIDLETGEWIQLLEPSDQ